MEISKESIFISSIRALFTTLLGTIGVFIAIVPMIFVIGMIGSTKEETTKSKLEILPDLNGNTKILSHSSPVILQMNLHGVIGDPSQIKSSEFKNLLFDSRKGFFKHNRVKAIFLHINSPGGVAYEADEIYRDLLTYKEKYNVPIYAYANGYLASGGYQIACAADKIYASPLSIIGSIGSLMGPFFNFSKAMDKYGIESKTVIEPNDKDIMNPFRPWSKDEDETLQPLNEFCYQRFISIVLTQRPNIDKDKLLNDYKARVFDTKKAKEIDFIDQVSSYEEALAALMKNANIDEDSPYQVASLSTKKHWLFPSIKTQMKSFVLEMMESIIQSLKFKNQTNNNYRYNG